MAFKYHLLFKTAQAEFRAWHELDDSIKRNILPIVEITRGRKIPGSGKDIDESEWIEKEGIFNFKKNIEKFIVAFKGSDKVIVDITREEELSCYEINEISISDNGYQNWITFLQSIGGEFNNLIPTLLINPSKDESPEMYKANLNNQLDSLMNDYTGVAYRASILIDPDFLYDLLILKNKINQYIKNGKEFWIELDHEFIQNGMGILHAVRTIDLIKKIQDEIPNVNIIILATSFPRNVNSDNHDSFRLEEEYIYEEIIKNIDNNDRIFYGDYGSINPLRNDIKGARGWVPRIDFPSSQKRTFYYREKRDVLRKADKAAGTKAVYSEYAKHYISVAKKVVQNDLFEDIPNSWGVRQIKDAAVEKLNGKAPSFWISVRMEIHILQQLKRLKSL